MNRNLRLRPIAAVGFDLDHTLANYAHLAVSELAFSATTEKLIVKKGYPAGIRDIVYDPDFLIRGLIVDLERGNLLKMDCFNYVQRAFHGKQSLRSAERKRIYASKQFAYSKSNYASIDTLFHIPEVYLYISLIDYFERAGHRLDFHQIFRDVRETIDEAHRDGTIKNTITADPARFITADPAIFDLFDRLRADGKKLFLLTNSEPGYTDTLMRYSQSVAGRTDSWKQCFDIIITRSNKPTFFSKRRLRTPQLVRGRVDLPRCRNAFELERILECKSGSIIYFGDHTYGDILQAKKTMGWRTGMIVPELHQEIASALKIRRAYHQLVTLSTSREQVERERSAVSGGGTPAGDDIEQRIQAISEEIDRLESVCQDSFNTRWGSLFREGKQVSRFGHQVRDFACIYMHKVSNCIHYPGDHYFQTHLDFMPHELFL